MRRVAGLAVLVLVSAPARAQVPAHADVDSAPVRFAIIGDYGLSGPNEQAVADLVHRLRPEFVATVGDNNYPSGSARTIEANIGRYYGKWIGSRRPFLAAGPRTNRFFPALGNHDWEAPGARPHLDYFDLPGNERYYDVRRGPVHLFIVDSDPREPDGVTADSIQALWLERALRGSDATWKLVLFHHAPFSSALHGSNLAMQWPFREWGASAVVAGHDHSYERLEVDGLPYFVNGLGGHSRYPFGPPVAGSLVRYNASYGAMWVEADDDACTFRFVTAEGIVVDTFVLASRGAVEAPQGLALVRRGTDWRYLDDGTDPGPFWADPGFDDGAWGTGPAQLGYGDGDEATVIGFGPDPNAKHVTSWFRREFFLSDPTAFSALELRVLRDDGAVVHLGGVEVFRTNMPAGPIDASTPASASVAGAEESALFGVTLPASLLASGRNVVAVEVHQSSPASSDLSFDLEMTAIAGTVLVPRGSTWRYLDDGAIPPGWSEPAFDDSAWSAGPAQLGYGEGDEATTVGFGPDPDRKRITTLFRHAFFVADASAARGLGLRILRDDGAVVRLNGREAYRSNLPMGPIGPDTRAGFAVAGADENVFLETRLSPGPLVDGWNFLAVEVHQSDPASSDLSFDLELVLR